MGVGSLRMSLREEIGDVLRSAASVYAWSSA
jgi:hypothetical protein